VDDEIPNLQKVIVKLSKKNAECNDIIKNLYENEKSKTKLDNLNILYVALTRAKEKLFVLTSHKSQKEKSEKTFLFDSFLNQENQKQHLTLSDEEKDVYCYGEVINKTRTTGELSKENEIDSKAGDWYNRIKIDPNPSMFWTGQNEDLQPQDWGNLVHTILSKIQTVTDINAALIPFVLDGSINGEKAKELKKLFNAIVNSNLIREAYAENATIKNECEILTTDGKILRPDHFAELQDKIYILDYKTGKEDPKHHQQLNNYINAVQNMVKKKILAYLVYINDDINVTPVQKAS
jgi:hypothetical protein